MKKSISTLCWDSRRQCARYLLCLSVTILSGSAFSASADYSGTWMPAADLSTSWTLDDLNLTAMGRDTLADFDSQRKDSTAFCMPYGTPRNTLNTVSDPLEILQKSGQITMIFESLGDVRRIFMDGRSHPEDPIPGWLGHSIGRWDGETLVVDTIGMTTESILTEQGFPHSDSLHLEERISLVERNQEPLMQIEMVLTDPQYYAAPLETTRYFRRAPYAELSIGSAICLLDQWRGRLESINRDLFRSSIESGAGEGQ